jgi:hypothetical protein
MRFKESFYFSGMLSNIEVAGFALVAYNQIISVIFYILNYEIKAGDLMISLIINIMIIFFVFWTRIILKLKVIKQNFFQIKNIPSKEIYVYNMLEMIMRNSLADQIKLGGMLKVHKKNCTRATCLCSQ